MALNWLDTALSVGADAVDWNEKKQQEQLEIRFKELQDNKELYRALATTRYSKDLEKYYKETEKYDNLKDVYKQIQSANGGKGMGKQEAALMIIGATPQLAFVYKNAADEEKQKEIIASVTSGFKDNYRDETTGSDADEVTKQVADGFTFSHSGLNLEAPKQKDYFQDPKYWGKLAEEIKSGTKGPLQNQILKLMGKEPAEVDLDTLEQKAGTTIKNDIDSVNYTSKNNSQGIVSDDDFNWSDFLEDNKDWYKRYNSLIDKVTWDNLNKSDHFIQWMSTNNLLGTNTEANFELSEKDTKIEGISPAGIAMLNSYKSIYSEVVKSLDARTLASMGIDITELSDKLNIAEVNKVVQNIIEQRGIKERFDEGAGSVSTDFISIMPLSIADAKGTYTTAEGNNYNIFTDKSNIPQVYHNWLKTEADKIKDRYEIKWKKDPVNAQAMAMAKIQASIESGGPYAKQLREYLDSEIAKAISEPKDDAENNTVIEGDLKTDGVVPAFEETDKGDIILGFSNGGKFQSWKDVEERGLVEKILKKYPKLKESYDKWKATQSDTAGTVSNTENNDDSKTITVRGKAVVVPNSTEDKKETTLTDTKEESTSSGVGNKPWLFSDGTFNPNFDESSMNMDKMYTVGTEANDYLKAKNLYEREQLKKKSILNKFFN